VIDQGTNEDEMFIMTFNNKTENRIGPDFGPTTTGRIPIFGIARGWQHCPLRCRWTPLSTMLNKASIAKKVLVVVYGRRGTTRAESDSAVLVEKVKESDCTDLHRWDVMAAWPTIPRKSRPHGRTTESTPANSLSDHGSLRATSRRIPK